MPEESRDDDDDNEGEDDDDGEPKSRTRKAARCSQSVWSRPFLESVYEENKRGREEEEKWCRGMWDRRGARGGGRGGG